MHDPTTSLTFRELIDLVVLRRKTLLLFAVAGVALALVGTLITPRLWSAHQGLLIRSDAAGYADQRLGKFTDLSEMKTVQETLLELTRSQSVVSGVLQEVGPAGEVTLLDSLLASLSRPTSDATWPTPDDIDTFRDRLRFEPPGGAEFGKTEVFYLGVLDPDRDRAAQLVKTLTERLEQRLQALRDQRAASLVDEVQHSVAVARQELEKSVARLASFEQQVGADLVELRNMTSSIGGQSEFSQNALAIENEIRSLSQQRRNDEALLNVLRNASNHPERLVSIPDALLTRQPGLQQMKSGLVEAQLSSARMGGARTADHPYVRAARVVHEKTLQEFASELPTAIQSVELDLEVLATREQELQSQLGALRSRSAELAALRTEYAELNASVESHTEVLRRALRQQADAEALRAAAASTCLLSRLDGVEMSTHPVGPSRKVVVAAGGLGGLLLGATVVLLLVAPPAPERNVQAMAPPQEPPRRRLADELNDAWALEHREPLHEEFEEEEEFGLFDLKLVCGPAMLLSCLLIGVSLLMWSVWTAQRMSLLAMALTLVGVAYVLGYETFRFDAGPATITLDRLLLLGVAATVAWESLARRHPTDNADARRLGAVVAAWLVEPELLCQPTAARNRIWRSTNQSLAAEFLVSGCVICDRAAGTHRTASRSIAADRVGLVWRISRLYRSDGNLRLLVAGLPALYRRP